MAVNQFNLPAGQRAERKLLITVAEWGDGTYTLTTSQPADWATNYTSYYTKSGNVYTPVTGASAPTWEADTYYRLNNPEREILGTRTEDSSIAYNPDIQTSTDILGHNFTDINKTQPQQDFDPYLVLGGSKLGAKLNDIRKRNALAELSQFTMYVITAFVDGPSANTYEAERHTGCTIAYTAMGGSANVNFPISVYFSNVITNGSVDKLADDFTFTPDVNI